MTEPKDTTLHKRIRSEIQARILFGAWPPGHRVPFEHELMGEYGCSRMTVNKALAPLAEAGLIVRQRKFGPRALLFRRAALESLSGVGGKKPLPEPADRDLKRASLPPARHRDSSWAASG